MIALLCAAALAAGPAPLAFHLENGLRVHIEPRPGTSSVAVLAGVRVGARHETPETSGAAHFLEHLLFTGTETMDALQVVAAVEERGGRWNGLTNLERTLFYAHVAADDLPLAMDWVSQVVFHPTFPEGQLERERQIIFQEGDGRFGWLTNRLDGSGLGYALDRRIRQSLFPGDGLGARTAGEEASIAGMDMARLRAFHARHYTASNTALVIVGGVDPQAARAHVERLFGGLPATEAPPRPPAPPTPEGPLEVVVRGPMVTDQVTLRVGARTAGRQDPDFWALELLSEVLTGDLMQSLRYEQGLVYALDAWTQPYADAGWFAVRTRCPGGAVEAVTAAIDDGLSRIRAGDLDPADVAAARAAMKGRYALAMESNLEQARWLGEWLLALPSDAPAPDYLDQMDAVTDAAVVDAARRYFVPARRFVGRHDPILTAARGGAVVGVLLALGLGLTLRRRRVSGARAPDPSSGGGGR